jgi:hypothetical protein
LKVGQIVDGFVKVRGVRTADLAQLCTIRITAVSRRRLNSITAAEVVAEGFPDWTTTRFINWFCQKMRVQRTYVLTFIAFEYVQD